jgi:hypothetical protein
MNCFHAASDKKAARRLFLGAAAASSGGVFVVAVGDGIILVRLRFGLSDTKHTMGHETVPCENGHSTQLHCRSWKRIAVEEKPVHSQNFFPFG